jgi:hypothetical protein
VSTEVNSKAETPEFLKRDFLTLFATRFTDNPSVVKIKNSF